MDFIPLYLIVELPNGDWVMGTYPNASRPMRYSLQFVWTAIHSEMGPMARAIIAHDLAIHVCQELGGNPAHVEVAHLGPVPHADDVYYYTRLDRVTQVGTADLIPCELNDLLQLAIQDRQGFSDCGVAFDRGKSLRDKLRS